MSICEQKIQHSSIPSELKPVVWCWPHSLCFCSMFLKHKVHIVMLENNFQQQKGYTNHWRQVAGGTIFCAAVPWYWCVLNVELPSCHITGIWNFKVPSRFLETLCILEWHHSKSTLCHVTCILSKLIFNILTFWMVQDSCCHIYMEIYCITICFILVVNTYISIFWKIRIDFFSFVLTRLWSKATNFLDLCLIMHHQCR